MYRIRTPAGRQAYLVTVGSRREPVLQHRQVVDADHGLVVAVSCVEVGRAVVVEIDADYNSVESADFRHRRVRAWRPA